MESQEIIDVAGDSGFMFNFEEKEGNKTTYEFSTYGFMERLGDPEIDLYKEVGEKDMTEKEYNAFYDALPSESKKGYGMWFSYDSSGYDYWIRRQEEFHGAYLTVEVIGEFDKDEFKESLIVMEKGIAGAVEDLYKAIRKRRKEEEEEKEENTAKPMECISHREKDEMSLTERFHLKVSDLEGSGEKYKKIGESEEGGWKAYTFAYTGREGQKLHVLERADMRNTGYESWQFTKPFTKASALEFMRQWDENEKEKRKDKERENGKSVGEAKPARRK